MLICLNHGAEEPENVLIAYLVGVESLRAGKQVPSVFEFTMGGALVFNYKSANCQLHEGAARRAGGTDG